MPKTRNIEPKSASSPSRKPNIIIIHPDLGIGGAERLILDVALSLQSRGHKVTIYTSHRDKGHCFEEARDGTLDVRVRGNTVFPAHVMGRFFVLMAVLRQVHLVIGLVSEMMFGAQTDADKDKDIVGNDTVFIVDQVPACVPILRLFRCMMTRRRKASGSGARDILDIKQRTLFYCHFPDQLLSRRDEGGTFIRFAKGLYRYPFDWFEGWAMGAADRIVVNSNFTRGVVKEVFGNEDVGVVYPCVDTSEKDIKEEEGTGAGAVLWGGLKILLSINRFERKKNIELAIRAYQGLGEKERKGTRLVIAGGYDNRVQENVQYHTELETLSQSFGFRTATSKTVVSALSIPDSIDVLFLLSVPSAFKQTLLSSASLLLYTPSREHFGIVPVEAMHSGLPVLADSTGGPLETIVEGKTGWLRPASNIDGWTDVIRRVLSEMGSNELEGMSLCGKQRAEREFSLSAMGDRLEGEVGDMLRGKGKDFISLQTVLFAVLLLGGLVASVFLGLVWKM